MTGRGILDADMATVGGWIARGWAWWLGELHGLIPARLAASNAAPFSGSGRAAAYML